MSLIKRPYEVTLRGTLAMMIYGQSGMGKTTFACSAPNPVLFDFDGSVNRLNDAHQVPTVQADILGWEEVFAALDELGAAEISCQTVVVDTVSKMIDKIIGYVCGNRLPAIKDWTRINAEFKRFLRAVQDGGRNVVFVAQREAFKEGDNIRFQPQVRESNYKDIVCDLDLLGYMEMVQKGSVNQRVITFTPTPRSEGKDCCGIGSVTIPELFDKAGRPLPNNLLATIIAQYQADQHNKAERKAAIAAEVDAFMAEWQPRVAAAATADDINALVAECKGVKFPADTAVRFRRLVSAHAAELCLKFNKESQSYEV